MIETKRMINIALLQARAGYEEGGIPIGAAIFTDTGKLLSVGRNLRVQDNDPAMHAETNAFRSAGRRKSYRDKVMVTTLSPCWYCSGLIKQFNFGTVIIGENETFRGGEDWLRESDVKIIVLDNEDCKNLLQKYITKNPDIWNEDIGEECGCNGS